MLLPLCSADVCNGSTAQHSKLGKYSTQSNMQHHLSMPGCIHESNEGRLNGLQLTMESFASPSKFSPHLSSYYSLQEEDQLFEANYDAHSTKWTGALQARPEYESAAMNKAVRWDIASCEDTDEPV